MKVPVHIVKFVLFAVLFKLYITDIIENAPSLPIIKLQIDLYISIYKKLFFNRSV